MAVTSVTEDFKGRRGSHAEGSGREYTRVFLVVTDDPSDGPLTVLNANGIPRPYDTYSSGNDVDLGVFCKSIDPEQDDASRTFWRVTCKYDAKIDQKGNSARENPDPRQRPADIRWTSTIRAEVVAIADRVQENGDLIAADVAVANSARDPFVDPWVEDRSYPTVSITVNRDTFDPQIKYDYEFSINSDSFLGGEPYSWKCVGIDAELQYETVEDIGLIPYYRITFGFEHNYKLWNPQKFLDCGFNALDGSGNDNEKFRVHDKNGEPCVNPVRLDGDGGVLPDQDDDRFVYYRNKRVQSFAALGLF